MTDEGYRGVLTPADMATLGIGAQTNSVVVFYSDWRALRDCGVKRGINDEVIYQGDIRFGYVAPDWLPKAASAKIGGKILLATGELIGVAPKGAEKTRLIARIRNLRPEGKRGYLLVGKHGEEAGRKTPTLAAKENLLEIPYEQDGDPVVGMFDAWDMHFREEIPHPALVLYAGKGKYLQLVESNPKLSQTSEKVPVQ